MWGVGYATVDDGGETVREERKGGGKGKEWVEVYIVGKEKGKKTLRTPRERERRQTCMGRKHWRNV